MSNRKSNFARAHNISLPSTKRKLNIDEATSALSSMGYRMGTVRHSLADKTSYWSVTTPTGSVVEVAANKLTDFVYGKIKNLNAQRYADELIRSLLPFEQEQIRNEGYKVYEVEICMPESGCNHYETVAAKDVRDAVRIGKAHAKGMKFNGVTKVNAKELHMKKSKSRFAVRHPSIAGAPLDPYTTKVPILLKDKTTVTAVRNDGRWSIEGRSEMPTARKFDQLIAELNAAGFTRLGKKAKYSTRLDTRGPFKPSGGPDADITGWSPKKDSPQRISETVASYKKMRADYTKALARMTPEYLAKNPSAETYPRRMILEANDYIAKHDHARNGAKAKFGEVENLLNMISDQMNSGNNDLAKTNLRKLAAKIGEIRHTRSEWDQFMTVAKSLGFTESQIGGFSRRGSKMTKSTYAISPLQELANKVQRLNAQYHLLADRAEETKIAANTAYRAYVEAKKILDDAIRSAGRSEQAPPQSERHSRGLSRNGAKATHAQVNIESKGVGSYYNSHLKEPRGTGSWSFIAPDGSILSAPGQMTLQAAKSWLKQNATINGYYKVAP